MEMAIYENNVNRTTLSPTTNVEKYTNSHSETTGKHLEIKDMPKIIIHLPTPEPELTTNLMKNLQHPNEEETKVTKCQEMDMTILQPGKLHPRYGPDSFYANIENGNCCINCDKYHHKVCISKVIIGLKKGTMFTAHIRSVQCHALVDIGASHSYMSFAFYEKLSLPHSDTTSGHYSLVSHR